MTMLRDLQQMQPDGHSPNATELDLQLLHNLRRYIPTLDRRAGAQKLSITAQQR